MKETINVAFGVTEAWLRYVYVTICSILANAEEDDSFKFYIMCDTTDINFEPMVKALNEIKKADYKFLLMDNSEFDGAIHDWLGVSSSYRLKLPSLVDDDKILYLDADTIVLDDIKKLYSYDVSDYYLAAIEDKLSTKMRKRVNLKDGETFINGGVQLMNLKRFREDNLEEKIFVKLRESKFYTDQDVINDICRGKILSLPLVFNLMAMEEDNKEVYANRREEYENALENAIILHYTNKPWSGMVKHGEFWFMYADLLTQLLTATSGIKIE